MRSFLFLALAWSLQPAPAAAQTEADRQTARMLMDRGDERVQQGDLAAALTLYRGAHEIMHVPTTGIEVARTYAKLGKLIEARNAALDVMNIAVGTEEPKPFSIARAEAETLHRELAERIPRLVLAIAPADAAERASVLIDGKEIEPAALRAPQLLNPEEHRVEAFAVGFEPVELRVALAPGEQKSLQIAFQALVTAPITAEPAHSSREIAAPGISWVTWTGLGILGAGVLTGSIAGVVSLGHASDAKEHCTGNRCTPEARADRDAALKTANLSNVGWASAGVGLVLSAVSFWLSRSNTDPRPAGAGFDVSASANAVVVEWHGTPW